MARVRVVAAVGGGEAETRAAGGVPAVARGARGHVAAAALARVLVPHVQTRVGRAPADKSLQRRLSEGSRRFHNHEEGETLLGPSPA